MREKRSLFGPNWQNDELSLRERAFVDPEEEMQLLPSEAPKKSEKQRRILGLIFCACVFALIGIRLTELQIIEGDKLREVAEQNRLQRIIDVAHRGRLYDRTGRILAKNDPDYRLLSYTNILPKEEDALKDVFAPLIVTCSLSAEELLAQVEEARRKKEIEFVLINNLAPTCAIKYLAEGGLPQGIRIEINEKRRAITDAIPSLSHVLGYTAGLSAEEYEEKRSEGYRAFDRIGKQGIEKLFEERLRGKNGETLVEVDAQGGVLRTLFQERPLQGEDIVLSLDASLHARIEQIIANRLENAPVQRASVIVMNPHTGEILAMVSYPAFDANKFSEGITQEEYSALINDPDAPLFNRSIAGSYPAGSTIKILYAAGALTDGIINPQTTFLSTGGLWLGNRFFPDWRGGGHGMTNVAFAIADSVNTFFYAIGGGTGDFVGMGIERLMEWAKTFGLGEYTGIGLSGESRGFLPSKAWKEEAKGEPWYIGDTYNVSIGQGDVLVSPLQIARMTAVFANGGDLVTPVLVKDTQGERVQVMEDDVVQTVQQGMRDTVLRGTAQAFQSLPVTSAGKTGTAQWSSTLQPHSWVTGYAPYENPEVVITVIVEQGGEFSLASPIAREVLASYFEAQSPSE